MVEGSSSTSLLFSEGVDLTGAYLLETLGWAGLGILGWAGMGWDGDTGLGWAGDTGVGWAGDTGLGWDGMGWGHWAGMGWAGLGTLGWGGDCTCSVCCTLLVDKHPNLKQLSCSTVYLYYIYIHVCIIIASTRCTIGL